MSWAREKAKIRRAAIGLSGDSGPTLSEDLETRNVSLWKDGSKRKAQKITSTTMNLRRGSMKVEAILLAESSAEWLIGWCVPQIMIPSSDSMLNSSLDSRVTGTFSDLDPYQQ